MHKLLKLTFILLFAISLLAPLTASAIDLPCVPSSTADGVTYKNDVFNCVNKLYLYGLVMSTIAAVFMIILAGYLYIFSGGNESRVGTAKSFVSTSLIGLAVLIVGFLILQQINPEILNVKNIATNQIAQQDWFSVGEKVGKDAVGYTIPEGTKGKGIKTGTPAGFPNYKQASAPWGQSAYGNCGGVTVADAGCGPTSLANVIKYYQDKNLIPQKTSDPGTVAKLSASGGFRVCGSGTSRSMFSSIAKDYNLTVDSGISWTSAIQALRSNQPVIASMGPGDFTSQGHYIVLYGIDSDGNILISDSGPRNITSAPIALVQSQQKYLMTIRPK